MITYDNYVYISNDVYTSLVMSSTSPSADIAITSFNNN